jgi:hypothetical protein
MFQWLILNYGMFYLVEGLVFFKTKLYFLQMSEPSPGYLHVQSVWQQLNKDVIYLRTV